MTFNSPIFLFLFLPILLALYFILGKGARNWILLLFSLFFFIYGDGVYIIVLIFFIITNYLFGLWINKYRKNTIHYNEKFIFILAIALNISILVFFKYSNFLIQNLNNVFNIAGLPAMIPLNIHTPLGISFITFTAISYMVDIHRDRSTPKLSPFKLSFYLSFFPKIISGPLDRYESVANQMTERTIDGELFANGIRRFIIGLAKKMLIADTLGSVVDQIFSVPADQLPAATAWLGIICFTIQLYFDFSGYTDMAIGLARMFGFRLMENFNYPYISSSIREFWRRWHISMSKWFRDYLYIPLGGNRQGNLRTYLNLLIVFFLCGLWHGASWTFVVWGLWYGVFLVLERTHLIKLANPIWNPIKHIYTMSVVILGWVFFRSVSLKYAWSFIGAMFGVSTTPNSAYEIATYINPAILIALIAGIIGSMPVIPAINSYFRQIEIGSENSSSRYIMSISYKSIVSIIFFIILIASMVFVLSESNRPFIYSQF